MILVDTNIFIDHLRNFAPAVRFVESLAGKDVLFSAITESELLAGKENNDSGKREKLLHFLHRWTKVPVDNPLVVIAGDVSRQYGLEIPDAIIAATAIMNKAVLVTKNVKDFQKVGRLRVRSPY